MDEAKDKRYIKEIIKEYNIRFDSWSSSEFWDLDQFRTLEHMIFEATDIHVNANTLKRFFQQRTENPQLATRDALCRLLGYAGYTDFVLKKTQKEEKAPEKPVALEDIIIKNSPPPTTNPQVVETVERHPIKAKKTTRLPLYLMGTLLLIIGGYALYVYKIEDLYINRLISKIKFTAVNTKGAYPLTVNVSYDIPHQLLDDVVLVYQESTGDTTEKKLVKPTGRVNATYIYEGDGFCRLKYKGQTIRTINVEARKPGWSIFTRNERKGIFRTLPIEEAYSGKGYLNLPLDRVLPEARPGHLFVSYVYYKKDLTDGDNFILEARVRNAAEDNAIPVSDVIMYLLSDTGMHGFALNEAGYAYMKFIGSEKTIKGDEYNLSGVHFNASVWHVLSIRVANKRTAFYMDGVQLLNIAYQKPIGMANEIILRFKGCGAVEYVKLRKLNGALVYQANFN